MGSMSFVSSDILARTNIELTLMEMHNLAYFYHWSREECWNTPCTERGVFNDRIRQQMRAESKGSSNSSSTPKSPRDYKENI